MNSYPNNYLRTELPCFFIRVMKINLKLLKIIWYLEKTFISNFNCNLEIMSDKKLMPVKKNHTLFPYTSL